MNHQMVSELRAELEKALTALDRAVSGERIGRIEKDILLERLRKVYDGVCELVPETKEKEEIEPLSFCMPERETNEPEPSESDPVEIVTTREITYTDPDAGAESTLIVEETIETTVGELRENPFLGQSPLDRSIIESLYGESEPHHEKPAPAETEEKSPEPAPQADPDPKSAGKVLNETFETEIKDVASMLSSQSAGRLSNIIGLNDRLMLLNDLFGNDAGVCDRTLDALDACDTIDDAYIYLYEHFTLDDNKEGVKLLISLLETKFS